MHPKSHGDCGGFKQGDNMAKFVLHDKHASAGTSTKLEAEDLQEAAVLAQATAQGAGRGGRAVQRAW